MRRNGARPYRHVQLCTLVLSGFCVLAGIPSVTQAQVGSDPTISDGRPLTQAERTERARQAERARAADVAPADRIRYEEHHRPGEMYVGGFGGYTFGHSFSNAQGTDGLAGTPFGSLDLKNSGVYGAKVGYFLPDRWNWLGFEVEGFNSSPNIKQSAALGAGATLRVTTVAFNGLIRGKFGCEDRYDDDVARRRAGDRDGRDAGMARFCRLQPYVGAGLGVFFAHLKGGQVGGTGGTSSDNAVPGFNGLAGVRFFLNEHLALFGEYKYTRATFSFDNALTPGAGLSGDYSVSHVVGGLSFHF